MLMQTLVCFQVLPAFTNMTVWYQNLISLQLNQQNSGFVDVRHLYHLLYNLWGKGNVSLGKCILNNNYCSNMLNVRKKQLYQAYDHCLDLINYQCLRGEKDFEKQTQGKSNAILCIHSKKRKHGGLVVSNTNYRSKFKFVFLLVVINSMFCPGEHILSYRFCDQKQIKVEEKKKKKNLAGWKQALHSIYHRKAIY